MVARLILALVLAAFALPALANGPCHDAPSVAAMQYHGQYHVQHHGSHQMPRPDDRATVTHVCIGCIPPVSLAARGLSAPIAPTTVPRRNVATPFDPASGTPPALPPPRARA